MSERRDSEAGWIIAGAMLAVWAILVTILLVRTATDTRDLQHRIGTIESQQVKR